jgi:hypothetical protein
MTKKILIMSFLTSFCVNVFGQKIGMESGFSFLNVTALNSELSRMNIFPISNSFITFGLSANFIEKPKYSIDIVYRVSSNLNNALFTEGSKDAIFNFQTAGMELRMFTKTFGRFKLEPILGVNYLWANLVVSDPSLDTTSIQAVLDNSQTTKTLAISRRMISSSLGGRISYEFQLKERHLSMGLYPQIASDFIGGFDSEWKSGRQKIYGLEKLNMRYLSVLGTISYTL